MKNDRSMGMCLIVPDLSSAFVLADLFTEACQGMDNFLLQNDELCLGSLSNIIGIENLKVGLYVTRDTNASLMDYFSEFAVIKNMTFMALTEEMLVLFKENWAVWECNEDKEKISSILQMDSRDRIQ